jgi:hypothetical protein
MTGDEHIAGLGKLLANLHSLELTLRIFLAKANGQMEGEQNCTFPEPGTKSVWESFLTNWDSLRQLIDKFNGTLSPAEFPKYRLDPSIVQARDAIAHGRLCAKVPEFPLTLWRFGKPNESGTVSVEQITELTSAWFREQGNSAYEQMRRVVSCAKARDYRLFPD